MYIYMCCVCMCVLCACCVCVFVCACACVCVRVRVCECMYTLATIDKRQKHQLVSQKVACSMPGQTTRYCCLLSKKLYSHCVGGLQA